MGGCTNEDIGETQEDFRTLFLWRSLGGDALFMGIAVLTTVEREKKNIRLARGSVFSRGLIKRPWVFIDQLSFLRTESSLARTWLPAGRGLVSGEQSVEFQVVRNKGPSCETLMTPVF